MNLRKKVREKTMNLKFNRLCSAETVRGSVCIGFVHRSDLQVVFESDKFHSMGSCLAEVHHRPWIAREPINHGKSCGLNIASVVTVSPPVANLAVDGSSVRYLMSHQYYSRHRACPAVPGAPRLVQYRLDRSGTTGRSRSLALMAVAGFGTSCHRSERF